MRRAVLILVLVFHAAGLRASPEPELNATVLQKPDETLLETQWLATTSYFFNQMRVIQQTPVVPTFPSPAGKPEDEQAEQPKPSVAQSSPDFGFFHDLNYDGKVDEFLPLQLPPLLGASAGSETDAAKVASRVFSLPVPSFVPAPHSADHQLWLEALSASQHVYFTDVAALARGHGGLALAAQWRRGATDLPAFDPAASQAGLARVPRLQSIWLAMLLGAMLVFWNRRPR